MNYFERICRGDAIDIILDAISLTLENSTEHQILGAALSHICNLSHAVARHERFGSTVAEHEGNGE